MANKGGPFEREICKTLSLWWTKQERDDVFWRSSQSGGRATMRARKGKGTFGHHGDIASTDPISAPATSVFCWELKRGYTKRGTYVDVIESPPLFSKRKLWEEFICQARTAAKACGAEFWLLVQRRDNAHAMIFFPFRLLRELARRANIPATAWNCPPFVDMWLKIRDDSGTPMNLRICACHLDFFLKVVTPAAVRLLDSSK